MVKTCLTCNIEYKTFAKKSKFCSKSCSAKHNNKGVRRHGNDPSNCIICGTQTWSYRGKYCSRKCQGIGSRKSIEHQRARNAHNQSKYRQKKYRKLHPTADKKLILEFYKNRPEGYEVDHIIPLSKGGLHHQDNLQYLPKLINRKKSNRVVGPTGLEPV